MAFLVTAVLPTCVLAGPRGFSGLSRGGPSGLILIPTGGVVGADCYAIGLHRGAMKGAYGILGIGEAGVALPDLFDSPGRQEWGNGMTGFVKLGGSPAPDHGWVPELGVGAENSPKMTAETYFVAGSWHWRGEDWRVQGVAGLGTGRFGNRMFAGVSVVPQLFLGNVMKFLAEFAGEEAILGTRLALSRNLRLDFALRIDARRITDAEGTRRWSLSMDEGILGASLSAGIEWRKIWETITFKDRKKKDRKKGAGK